MGLRLHNVQIDVPADRYDEVVRFWAAALDAEAVDTPAGFVHLHGARSVVEVHLQRLPAGEVPRYHLDLAADDPAVEADRLEALGATRLGWEEEAAWHGGGWWVMQDPAGLLFCVVTGAPEPDPLAPRDPRQPFLLGLFVDVPADLVRTELDFWAAALDATVEDTSRPGTYTALKGITVGDWELLFEVQRLNDGSPRYHVDLEAADVTGEAARLEALGATRVHDVETWTTLTDPAGNLFCVVPADGFIPADSA